jgi:uncharacterized protein (DUF934 family)
MAVSTVILGCGSSHATVGKADLLSKGDAICRRSYDQALATDNERLSAHASNQRIASLQRAQIAALSSLGTPDRDAQRFHDMLAAERLVHSDFLAYIRGRSHSGAQLWLLTRHEQTYRKLSMRFGFKICATMD